VLQPQPYFGYGVATDDQLHCLKDGKPISNLYAIGSVLSGHDAVKMGDGTGVSLLTALAVNDHIIAKK
jgi:glycerol-3-phosphate dehydrogenase subunit B